MSRWRHGAQVGDSDHVKHITSTEYGDDLTPPGAAARRVGATPAVPVALTREAHEHLFMTTKQYMAPVDTFQQFLRRQWLGHEAWTEKTKERILNLTVRYCRRRRDGGGLLRVAGARNGTVCCVARRRRRRCSRGMCRPPARSSLRTLCGADLWRLC